MYIITRPALNQAHGLQSGLNTYMYILLGPVHNMTLVAFSVAVRCVAYRHGAQTGSQFLHTNA